MLTTENIKVAPAEYKGATAKVANQEGKSRSARVAVARGDVSGRALGQQGHASDWRNKMACKEPSYRHNG